MSGVVAVGGGFDAQEWSAGRQAAELVAHREGGEVVQVVLPKAMTGAPPQG